MSIHSTAIIDKSAEIDSSVEIGPYVVIGKDCVIGKNTIIHSHTVIGNYTTIGSDCNIFSSAAVGTEPQDRKYSGEKSFTVIGNGNIIREYVTINRAEGEGNQTIIGDQNMLMAYSHVAHNCKVGNLNVLANSGTLAGHVEVGNNITIGGLSAVHQFVHLGDFAMIGGLTKIIKDIPPYMLVDGNPAQVRGTNKVGLERNGFTSEERLEIKRIYKILYRRNYSSQNALKALQELKENSFTRYVIEFIERSKRGLTRSSGKNKSDA